MKTLLSTIFGLVFTLISVNLANANDKTSMYSHLPLDVKEFIYHELSNPNAKTIEPVSGSVYLEFYIDENQNLVVTELSSNNLMLGEYVKNELTDLPQLSSCCRTGIKYNIKILMCCNK